MTRFGCPLRLILLSSGPHHGHYVTIIKAGGVWKLFDDDAVETIKESDIPKYFGDSNCGSAYVLYYQAVDINLPSLGLRSPTPPPATNPVPVPTSVSVPLDDGQAPTLPPGLTTEHDSSDPAESSGPTTPAPSNPTYSPKISNSPNHSKLNLPPHDFPPPPPIPQQPTQKPQGGLFHSLRHVPSVKINRHSTDKKPLVEAVSMVSTNSSASGSLPSPANISSPQLLNKPEATPSLENPPVEPTSQRNSGIGKDKWYKRKGIKNKEKEKEKEKEKSLTSLLKAQLPDRRPNTAPGKQFESLGPPSPASTVGSISQRSSSPSHPQSDVEGKGEGHVLRPSLMRKSSAPAPRSSGSTSFADDVPAVPPLPPLPVSPTVRGHRTPRPLPQTRPSLPAEMSQRRATLISDTTGQVAGEFNGHAMFNGDFNYHSKPRPNSLHADMLASTSSSSSELLTPTPGAPSDTTSPSFDSSSSGMTTTSQTMVGSPLSTATTPATAAGQGSAGTGSNWKKATRKLSLTGTMLGFSKKEKYRDKLGAIS